jgi:hypothetical protein
MDGGAIATAFSQYQTFVKTAPNELSMTCELGPSGNSAVTGMLIGNYFGSKADFINLVSSLVSDLGATITTADEYTDWSQALVATFGEPLVSPGPDPPYTFFTKSLIITDLLSDDALLSWGNNLIETADSDIDWWAVADLLGGATSSDFDAASSSFAHRDAFLIFRIQGSSYNNAPYPADGIDLINNMVTSIEPNPTAACTFYSLFLCASPTHTLVL